jgi:hypothetical protein
MKREIAKYVSECDTYQRVKASHLKVSGTLQPLPIPSWKWEDISIDFIVGLPNTSQKHDSIWVIIDRLTKVAHFLPVHTTYTAKKYAECRVLSGCPPWGIPKVVGFGLGCAEIRNSKVQTTQDLDRFRPQYA